MNNTTGTAVTTATVLTATDFAVGQSVFFKSTVAPKPWTPGTVLEVNDLTDKVRVQRPAVTGKSPTNTWMLVKTLRLEMPTSGAVSATVSDPNAATSGRPAIVTVDQASETEASSPANQTVVDLDADLADLLGGTVA